MAKFGHVLAEKEVTLQWLMNSNMVKPKKFGPLHLVYCFTVPLISLFHVKIQEPTSRSTTTRAIAFLAKFAECYYHKTFDARSRWQPKCLCGWT